MENSQKTSLSKIPFIDFVPAEVKETAGDNWRIVFYAKKPGTNKMERFRRRVKKLHGYQNRMRFAKRICAEINNKLYEGWSPFQDYYSKNEYQLLFVVMDLFLEQCQRRLKDNLFRPDSLRSYTSYIVNIKEYMKSTGKADMFTVEFNKKFILDFLDHIYFHKKRSARTSNNYLAFCNLLTSFMFDREYLVINPTTWIPRRKVGKKKRLIIPAEVRNEIFKYLSIKNKSFLCLCLMVYFCFIRRTEISKLLVKQVNIKDNTIFIPKEVSKNGKDGIVTIPRKLKEILITHLNGSTQEDFLFSADYFKPGKKQLNPKKISDTWTKIRAVLKFKSEYQFYSLKDTGITELFLLNVPVIKIRDQARHHDIKITETYTPRNYVCDETIKNLEFNF